MKSNIARTQKRCPNDTRGSRHIRHIRHERAAFMRGPVVHETMAVREPNTTDHRSTREQEIDLADYSEMVPDGTTIELTFRGTRSSYTIDVERNSERFHIEGAGPSATLTGVYGDADANLERVPSWLRRVLIDRTPANEVSYYNG